jgi:hypothetical protein
MNSEVIGPVLVAVLMLFAISTTVSNLDKLAQEDHYFMWLLNVVVMLALLVLLILFIKEQWL